MGQLDWRSEGLPNWLMLGIVTIFLVWLCIMGFGLLLWWFTWVLRWLRGERPELGSLWNATKKFLQTVVIFLLSGGVISLIAYALR